MSAPIPTVPIEGVVYTVRDWAQHLWIIRDMVSTDPRTARAELARFADRLIRYADRLENEASGWPASPRSSDGLGSEAEIDS